MVYPYFQGCYDCPEPGLPISFSDVYRKASEDNTLGVHVELLKEIASTGGKVSVIGCSSWVIPTSIMASAPKLVTLVSNQVPKMVRGLGSFLVETVFNFSEGPPEDGDIPESDVCLLYTSPSPRDS